MKNRQSFKGRGPEKRIRIRRSFSNGRKSASHLLQEPQNALKTANRLSFSRLGTRLRSLCIKWMTTGPDIPKTVNGSVTLKDEPHLRPARNPAQPGRQAAAPKDKPY